jgi:hypothetical protein
MTWGALSICPYMSVEAPPAPPLPVIIAPDECFLHHTCAPITRGSSDPPPENVNRLQVGTDGWCSPRHRMPFKLSVESGIEIMVSIRVRPIRTVHYENPTDRLTESATR